MSWLKKLWNIKVTVIPFLIGRLGSHERIGTKPRGLGNKNITY